MKELLKTDPSIPTGPVDGWVANPVNINGNTYTVNTTGGITAGGVTAGGVTAGGMIGASGSGNLGAYGIISTAPIPSMNVNQYTGMTKTKVRYIVVKNDGSTLELREKSTITPLAMIGISKFLSLISVFAGNASVNSISISWTDLIDTLSIKDHFVNGLHEDDYPDDDDAFNIFLYDD